MAYINIEVWDATGNKKQIVEVPDDVPINRIIVLLIDRLNYPKFDATGGQLLSYKLHHQSTRKQLIDTNTLQQSDVKSNDILRLVAEIIAGGNQQTSGVAHEIDTSSEGRFERFKLINWWDQKKLLDAKVLVIGSGALGNEILKNLALLGIGNIFIADMDVVENSNLSRSILFRQRNNGKKKAEVASYAVKEIYPDVNVQWFNGDIIYDLGLGVFIWADIVIAGLDNREARLAVNRNCWKTNTPWIDGAIEQLNGVVRVFVPPHGACYECTLSEVDWKIIKARKACSGLTRDEMLTGKVPTTPTSASLIAGIQCQEAVKLLHGLDVLESKGFIFNGLSNDAYIVDYPIKKNCASHESFNQIRNTGKRADETTIRELLGEVSSILGDNSVLEFSKFDCDIVESFHCPQCGTDRQVFQPMGKTTEKQSHCPDCGTECNPNFFHSISGKENFLDKSFTEIGIPPFDVIVGRNGINEIYLLFDGDAQSVLGPVYYKGEN